MTEHACQIGIPQREWISRGCTEGAYPYPEDLAYSRSSPELPARFRRFATELLLAGRKCSTATHDRSIQHDLAALIWSTASTHAVEHFLYVLNRIAEEPLRVYQALVDLLET